ncbi:MAG: low temperature requirement protein A, partial [Alphaproteobacteria bacterium]|nr:low temperature requirement protein A [Alphaproteobacteria bacterium]
MSDAIRKATWLELFFDLIFVVAVMRTAHVLQHAHGGHITGDSYLKFVLIMIPLWWTWVGATMFANRFSCEDTGQRLMSLAQMFAILVMGVHISADFDTYYQGFLFSYLAVRLLTVLMYLRAARGYPETRHVSGFLALVFGLGALFSLSSLMFEGVARYAVLYGGIAFEMLVPLLARKRLRSVPVHAHHLPERFGLLAIIVLGESMMTLTGNVNVLALSPVTMAMVLCGFILVCGLWWLYFDNIDRRINGHELGHGHGIIYSHLLLYIGLGGVAAMIRFAVIPELHLTDYKYMAAFAVLSFMVALQFLHLIYQPVGMKRPLMRNALLFNAAFVGLLLLAPSVIAVMA